MLLKHAGVKQKRLQLFAEREFLNDEASLHANILKVPHVTPAPMDQPFIECTIQPRRPYRNPPSAAHHALRDTLSSAALASPAAPP